MNMPRFRSWWIPGAVLGVALGYFMLGRLAFSASVSHAIVTVVVFGAEGIALGAVLRWGPWMALGVFLGQALLAWNMGLPVAACLAVSAVNGAECLLALGVSRKLGLDPNLSRLRDVVLLFAISLGVLQVFSASLGVGSLWALGRIPAHEVPAGALNWWMGNALGQCIVAPAFLVATRQGRAGQGKALLSAAGVAGVAILTFGLLPFWTLPSFVESLALYFPILVAIAFLHGTAGGAYAGLFLSAVVVGATSLGRGPFTASWIELDFFLLGAVFTTLSAGALFSELRQTEERLLQKNSELNRANRELQEALKEVRTLEGFLPICAYCKQIRDDQGYWNGLEDYLTRRSGVLFSHGICPNCRAQHFPDVPLNGERDATSS